MKRRWLPFIALLAAANAAAGISYRFEGTAGAGRVIVEGAKMRVEFLRDERVVSVVLSSDGGKTLTMLDPAKKTFRAMSVDEILDAVTISNAKTSARDLGDGGKVEGYPTRKWLIDSTYDMRVGDMTVHFVMHSESWRTDRIAEGAELRSGRVIDKLLPPQVKGFPLKEVMTIRANNSTMTSTTAVHDIRNVATTPAQFAIPAGYKRAQ